MGKRVLRRKKSVLRRLAGVLYGLLVALSAVIVALYVIYNVMKEEPTMAPGGSAPPVASGQQDPQTSADPQGLTRKEGTYTVLLTCPDVASGNADTIMVAMYDTVNQKAGLVSIPRDTLVEGESPGGNHYYKINSSYHYGIDELKETVSDLLGIPIDYYVSIDVETFPKLVDMVGGVDFEIPVYMDYEDPTQDLYIYFQPGMTHLDGQEAMEVCRFRHNNWWKTQVAYTDVERTQTQQQILTLIAQKILSQPDNIPGYIELIAQNVETDFSLGEMLWFVEPALGFDLSTGLSTATLPGDGEVTYHGWTYCYGLYPEETLEILNEMLNPYTTPITLEMTNIVQAS